MKQVYIERPQYDNKVYVDCKTLATAKRRTPWASRWAKTDGGWIAFAFVTDYETWKNQK